MGIHRGKHRRPNRLRGSRLLDVLVGEGTRTPEPEPSEFENAEVVVIDPEDEHDEYFFIGWPTAEDVNGRIGESPNDHS